LQSLDSQGSRLFGPIRVDLNAIPMGHYPMQQVSERHAISYAGIERGKSLGKPQPIPESPSLGYRKGEKT